MGKIFRRENRQLLLVVLIIAGAIILSRIVSGTRTLPRAANELARLPVTVSEIHIGAHPVQIRTTGRVKPRSTVTITPQVAGRVERVSEHMYDGGYFKQGQTLFRIEAADYQNDVARERAAVAKAQTELALERAEADAAVAEWRTLNEQVPPPLVSRAPQIAQAQAELAAAQARLAQAELNLSRTEYQLPFDGRVMNSSIELGDFVLAGQNYGEVYNQNSLEIVLSLPVTELRWLGDGENVNIDIAVTDQGAAADQRHIPGTILRLGATLDDSTRFQQMVIKPLADHRLLPGMLADVTLSSAPVDNTWVLPAASLQAGQKIWVVDEQMKLLGVEPTIISTMPAGVIARLPLNLKTVRVVDVPIAGGTEGAEVLIIDAQQSES